MRGLCGLRATIIGAATCALTLLIVIPPAKAEIKGPSVKIGVLTDMSSFYSVTDGAGSVEAARMAAEDFGNKVNGKPIEIIFADHQNKPDIGAGIARKWFDEDGVDAMADLNASSVTFAVMEVARQRNKMLLISGAGSSDITNKSCMPTAVHWTYDTYASASIAKAILARGGDSWFFVTSDWAFGHALQRDTTAQLDAAGGKVVGGVSSPVNTHDYSSFLLQAQASKAKVLALATGGDDTTNALKQAREFGIDKSMTIVALQAVITDIHAIGLPAAQGLIFTSAFYWNRTPDSTEWSRRYFARTKAMPTMMQAGVYSSVHHYLQAVEDTDSTDALTVMAKMKATPVHDMFAPSGKIRDDGRMVHDMYLLQVKSPAESTEAWDYMKVLSTIPGDQAFRPLSQSECPLIKKADK